jgi:hypothetical protein
MEYLKMWQHEKVDRAAAQTQYARGAGSLGIEEYNLM